MIVFARKIKDKYFYAWSTNAIRFFVKIAFWFIDNIFKILSLKISIRATIRKCYNRLNKNNLVVLRIETTFLCLIRSIK